MPFLREMSPGVWGWHEFDADLEPAFDRWRVSRRTAYGVEDIATTSTLEDAEDAIAEWLHEHRAGSAS